MAGIVLNVPSLESVQVLDSAPAEPFAESTVPIASVGTFQPDRVAGRRIKVEGVVTLEIPWQGFYLQDGPVIFTASVGNAARSQAVPALAAGSRLHLTGVCDIQGHCSLLLAEPQNSALQQDSLLEVSSAAERAANLTRQLLMFSRKQPLRPKLLDLNELVSHVVKMLHRLLGEHIQLECAYGPNLPAVPADAGMIEQVVVNLSVNGRDAMPSGGRLTIRTEAVNIDSESVRRHPESRPGPFVTLTVEDTGHGMDEATMKHLFEPFFTTKEIGKGTGLGLASVYGIVKPHQGWVQVTSQPQAGSRFTVFLPASDKRSLSIDDKPAIMDVPGGTETILVVEDEPALRSLIEMFLKGCGYRVLTAASGKDAIPVWEKHKSEIDLLLTDLVMPEGMTGGELAPRLNSQKPALKIIFTSGYSADSV